MPAPTDTIAAIATGSGSGGIGIVRVSGPDSLQIATTLCGQPMQARYAHYCKIRNPHTNELIDRGIALYFQAPNSFTGEDTVEFQAHGGSVVLDLILQCILKLGARLAEPGEFTQRAYLNDKIDLAQAEAVADLIQSGTQQAALSAARSLQGEFSQLVNTLAEDILKIRVYVEAALDFPEEEIDFLNDQQLHKNLAALREHIQETLAKTRQGSLLRNGISLVLAGAPNAGKSSLMNALAGFDSAIVSSTAGTTRDVLREQIQIDGLPVRLVDTAGLHSSMDDVELEGMRRAIKELEQADQILLLVDINTAQPDDIEEAWPDNTQLTARQRLDWQSKSILVRSKIDLYDDYEAPASDSEIYDISVRSGAGLDDLRAVIKEKAGFQTVAADAFTARRRHIDALSKALVFVHAGEQQLLTHGAGELLAQDLHSAHDVLSSITGKVSSDDILGEIFSSFCIGK